jgi:hypothetical protein
MELDNGELTMFFLTPFREIKQSDLLQYKGYHPRKLKGQPLPDYLYKFYGLKKNDESMSEVVRLRITPTEKTKLEAYAASKNQTVSDLLRGQIRDWIK